MALTTSFEHNSDFRQMDLPLDLWMGERILLWVRLEAETALGGAWYELYLVKAISGFLVEKHSGPTGRHGQKEIWFRRTLTDAEKKYFQILNSKLNPNRRSPRKYKVVRNFEGANRSIINTSMPLAKATLSH